MFLAITVSLIISILSLVVTFVWMTRTVRVKDAFIAELVEEIKVLRDREAEHKQSPDDKLQSMKQKLEYARKMLLPKVYWKTGMSIEEVAYHQGKADTLDWLEKNHTTAPLNVRHVR